jgi:DNA helicase II / ATP-dependent DNA helicase PcrA
MKDFVLTGMTGNSETLRDYQSELNEEQFAAVSAGDGPHLVLAGAGSGKTRVVTYRVAWLLEHDIRPEEILLLTFTNKAAKEMITRVESLLQVYPAGLWAGTFHSIANRLLRMYGDHTPYGRDFSILDEDDAQDLLKLCVKEVKVDTFGRKFPSVAVIKSVVSFAENARLSLAEALARRAPTHEPLANEIGRVLAKYKEEKLRQRVLDFDDLLLELYRLLREDEHVRFSLARRFRYVMVDEFQDTNLVQADIVDLLSSHYRNILAVGDDAQSIYSFRAAEIQNILDFGGRYSGAVVHRLVTNYRSTPQILAVANAVIANNEDQYEKELVAVARDGEKPFVVPAADERQEAQYVAEQILALLHDGVRLRDIAVLFRAAFHSQSLEFELMRRAIPYEYRGGMKFFERAHVKDALAHLRILRNVKDGVAWMRALQIQSGMGLATAAKVANYVSVCETIADALANPPKLSDKAQQGWLCTSALLATMAVESLPAHMLRAFAGSDTYREYLDAEYQNARERREDLEQFALFAEQYQELGSFLDAVTLTGDFGGLMDPEQGKRDDAYTEEKMVLSTIHQAKGLEWETVFVINVAEGAFPSDKSFAHPKEIEEERRLFYVATTRAKKRLFLTYGITAGYENVVLRQPSTFLDEIPKELIEEVRLRQSASWGSDGWSGRSAGSLWSSSSSRRKLSSNVSKTETWDDGFSEPTIVLDNNGESVTAKKKSFPTSFLGNY